MDNDEVGCHGFTPYMRTRTHRPPGDLAIAHKCDWTWTRGKFSGDLNTQPKTVFVRSADLISFSKLYLPKINSKFVLITGDEDITCPRQLNNSGEGFRLPLRNPFEFTQLCYRLLDDNRIHKWYAENCDLPSPKMSGIPLGLVAVKNSDPQFSEDRFNELCINFDNKLPSAMCMNRHLGRRGGSDNHDRRMVENYALNDWTGVDVIPEGSYDELVSSFKKYAFSVIVHGGGLDPSPKAWISMIEGCIPIIEKKHGVYDAYKELPVVFVDWWYSDTITQEKLNEWLTEHREHYEDPQKRCEMLHKLSLAYWWSKIESSIPR